MPIWLSTALTTTPPFSFVAALLVFYVPSESGEKVTLGISALLSMTVFLMTIRESLPPTEKTPLISESPLTRIPKNADCKRTDPLFPGLYYGVSICLVSFASAMAVVTLNIHHRGLRGTEVPDVVKKVVLGYMSRIVFLHFDAILDPNEDKREKRNSFNVKLNVKGLKENIFLMETVTIHVFFLGFV